MASSIAHCRLGEDSWLNTGLDGDCTSGRESTTGVSSRALDAGTSRVITRSETRHAREGKRDAVVLATGRDKVPNADDEALRDIDCSRTNTSLNWYTCLQQAHQSCYTGILEMTVETEKEKEDFTLHGSSSP